MSRRNKQKNRNARQGGAQVTAPRDNELGPVVLKQIGEAANARLTDEDLVAIGVAGVPEHHLTSAERDARVLELHRILESQTARFEADRKALDRQKEQLAEREKKLKESQETFSARLNELKTREAGLKVDEEEYLKRHEALSIREADADAKFAKRNREALEALDREREALLNQILNARNDAAVQVAELERELQDLRLKAEREISDRKAEMAREREDLRQVLMAERTRLDEQASRDRDALETKTTALRRLQRELESERELLEEDKEDLESMVRRRAAREMETLQAEVRALTKRLEVAHGELKRSDDLLAQREEADRRFGGETPDQVLGRLRSLEAERNDLRRALGERPSAEAALRLEQLTRQQEQWEADRLSLLAELQEAKQEAARRRIAVTELESLRDEKRALESANSLLHEAIRQLEDEVDGLVKRREAQTHFPAVSALDSDSDLQHPVPLSDDSIDLTEFAHFVRHSMAWNPDSKRELYYRDRDVRSFIGGLAMSRLHLLQGISGTGKTSLPLAFARAIGAGSEVIEVQAGWRDRQDLIGHYNSFERQYYETEFLQALYRAGTPRYKDVPFIIVLDEMNLSHPEQYFADLLSALEQDTSNQLLVLMSHAVEKAPSHLVEGGKKLPIPSNVWFVGTANHDETTRDFADKTYDRAHVMELPQKRELFRREQQAFRHPTSMRALTAAFEAAQEEHQHAAREVYDFLTLVLSEELGRNFGVGWGNRLERQLSQYVPVVIAAGGTIGEAADHILATKLLRKIRDKHDNRPEDLRELKDLIQREWNQLDSEVAPDASIELINWERHRLGDDEE